MQIERTIRINIKLDEDEAHKLIEILEPQRDEFAIQLLRNINIATRDDEE
jgi:hypothetical protein